MLKRLGLIAISSFAVGIISSSPGHSVEENVIYDAIIKLIMKYEELSEKVGDLEKRINLLEKRIQESAGDIEVDMRRLGRARTWVNLRSGPGTEYRKILTLRPGEQVEILGKRGKWYKVKTKEGFIGYSHGDYIVEVRR